MCTCSDVVAHHDGNAVVMLRRGRVPVWVSRRIRHLQAATTWCKCLAGAFAAWRFLEPHGMGFCAPPAACPAWRSLAASALPRGPLTPGTPRASRRALGAHGGHLPRHADLEVQLDRVHLVRHRMDAKGLFRLLCDAQ